MKLRAKFVIPLVTLGIAGTLLAFLPANKEKEIEEETRQKLREQGFKTELTDFDLAITPEEQAREVVLIAAGQAFRDWFARDTIQLMKPVSRGAARVSWQQLTVENGRSENLWEQLRTNLSLNQALLDKACAAVIAGPIRFEPTSGQWGTFAPYLAPVRELAFALAVRTAVDLHFGQRDSACANLVALTRLVTAWKGEQTEVTMIVRCFCSTYAHAATWEALQAGGWTEEQLGSLEREWLGVDWFGSVARAVAYSRAVMVERCRFERQQPGSPPVPLPRVASDFLDSPAKAWADLTVGMREARYRNAGSYEDETAILLYYRDRELEIRQATNAPTWASMRTLPAATNTPPFRPNSSSPIQSLMSNRPGTRAAQGPARTLLSRVAEAEARRRLILAAIELERFHVHKGYYPETLDDLSPELVKNVPSDFIDGQPLRYSQTDGHFVLYSVGLDCIDEGGEMTQTETRGVQFGRGFGRPPEPDLVWPRPATATEIAEQKRIADSASRQN